MRIEILLVPECPHADLARQRVRDAVATAGIDASIREIIVGSLEDADRLKMRGSPTILIDGRDAVATFDAPSLSCRLYRTPDGLQGAPLVADLMLAVSVITRTDPVRY